MEGMENEEKCIRCGDSKTIGSVRGVTVEGKGIPPLPYCERCWPNRAGAWKQDDE